MKQPDQRKLALIWSNLTVRQQQYLIQHYKRRHGVSILDRSNWLSFLGEELGYKRQLHSWN